MMSFWTSKLFLLCVALANVTVCNGDTLRSIDEWFLGKPITTPGPDSPKMRVLRNHTAYIYLPFHNTYRRIRGNRIKNTQYEHVYRVCTEHKTTDCGFWMNVKNNKTVPSGRTYYNHSVGNLVVENFQPYDSATYFTGDKQQSYGAFIEYSYGYWIPFNLNGKTVWKWYIKAN